MKKVILEKLYFYCDKCQQAYKIGEVPYMNILTKDFTFHCKREKCKGLIVSKSGKVLIGSTYLSGCIINNSRR